MPQFLSLGPISLIMIILTHILVQVLCVSSIDKTLYWNMAWEAIFATISPFLVIDDNTTKASKMNCKNMKLIPIWKVRNYLAYSYASHNPMMAWPPPKTMIPTLFLPLSCYFSLMTWFTWHVSPLEYTFPSWEHFSLCWNHALLWSIFLPLWNQIT